MGPSVPSLAACGGANRFIGIHIPLIGYPDSAAIDHHDRDFHPLRRLLDWPATPYALYLIHLMVAVPMLVLEVPFAKWAHLLYRLLVLYLMKVKEKYLARQLNARASG
jgi:hypothetical protein